MDINQISDLVQAFGVNVVLIGAMAFFIYKLWEQSVVREDKLMETNSRAISTIEKCTDKLSAIESDVKEIKEDMIIITSKMNN